MTLSPTTRRRSALAAILVCAGALAGCAAPDGPAASAIAEPVDPLACGITVTPFAAVVGDEVLVTRAGTEPGATLQGEAGPGECGTLVPGSTQTLELSSSIHGHAAQATVVVVVGGHGAFEARMRLPTGIRLGDAIITAIPPAEFGCPAVTAETTEECILPRAYFTVGFAPEDLEPLRTRIDAETPVLPQDNGLTSSYVLPGPAQNELTLVIWGSSCPARPAAFVRTSAPDRLQIVSTELVPEGEGCDTLAKPWTTVIEIPAEFAGYRSITVDNVEAILPAG